MKNKELEFFPGQRKGVIKILIKDSEREETVQLSFDLDLNITAPAH